MKKKEMTARLFELEARVAQLEARLYQQQTPGRMWHDVHPDPYEMTVTWGPIVNNAVGRSGE